MVGTQPKQKVWEIKFNPVGIYDYASGAVTNCRLTFVFPMTGPNAGEMMMSVFWYYRPEQTEVGRVPNFHGEVTHRVLLNSLVKKNVNVNLMSNTGSGCAITRARGS